MGTGKIVYYPKTVKGADGINRQESTQGFQITWFYSGDVIDDFDMEAVRTFKRYIDKIDQGFEIEDIDENGV